MTTALTGTIETAVTLVEQQDYHGAYEMLRGISLRSCTEAELGRVCAYRSLAARRLGDPHAAIREGYSALASLRRWVEEEKKLIPLIRLNLGWSLLEKGHNIESLEAFNGVVVEQSGAPSQYLAIAHNGASWACRNLGKTEDCERHLAAAADIYEQLHSVSQLLDIEHNLGDLYIQTGELRRAVAVYMRTHGLREANKQSRINGEVNVALALARQRKFEKAIVLLRSNEANCAPGTTQFAHLHLNWAEVGLLSADYDLAREHLLIGLRDNLRGTRNETPDFLRKLADCRLRQGRADLARKYALKAAGLAKKRRKAHEVACCCRTLGLIEAHGGHRDRALKYISRALGIFERTNAGYDLAMTRWEGVHSGMVDRKAAADMLVLANQYFSGERIEGQDTPPKQFIRDILAEADEAPPLL